jgi:hypothetical protein|tara:strand:+ start:1345 stop:1521 length:177 start_codon:yes stop_codon:yes gene_type:complete
LQIETLRNQTIEQADLINQKINQDVEIADGQRLIVRSANGSRFKIVVSDAGVLSATSI